jgi:hypothetical protein
MTRIRELKDGKLSAEFDSPNDVFRVIRKLGWKPQQSKSSDDGDRGDFHTFNSLAEAIDVFENKPDSIRQFSINDDRLERPDSPGKDVQYDITGDYLDIDRYLTGEPEMFGNAVMGNPKNIFCTINILSSFVWYTSPEYQLVKQKRVLRLVDWLETQGVRCQVISQDDSRVAFISTIIKEYQDPFNLNDLAVSCHPDWLRRIEFLVMEQSKTWEAGYGSSEAYDKRMLKYKPNPEDGMYIYIGGYCPYGGWGSNDVDRLNKEFDRLEGQIAELVDNGITWNDIPFTIGGS